MSLSRLLHGALFFLCFFFISSVSAFDVVDTPTPFQKAQFTDFQDIFDYDIYNPGGVCGNRQIYYKVVIGGATVGSYLFSSQTSGISSCDPIIYYTRPAGSLYQHLGSDDQVRLLRFNIFNDWYLINTENSNFLNIGNKSLSLHVSDTDIVTYNSTSGQFDVETYDDTTMSITSTTQVSAPVGYVLGKEWTPSSYVPGEGWYYVGVDNGYYFLSEDLTTFQNLGPTWDNYRVLDYIPSDVGPGTIFAGLSDGGATHETLTSQTLVNGISDFSTLSTTVSPVRVYSFDGSEVYFRGFNTQLGTYATHSWNRNCTTPGYTTCSAIANDGSSLCTSNLVPGVPSPGGEFCSESVIVTDDIIANYNLDGNANDTSGSGFHGVVYGASLTTGKEGEANTAYDFDGLNDGIVLSNMTGSISNGDFTVAMWINIDSFTSTLGSLPDTDIKGALFYGLNPYFRLGIGNNNKLLLQEKIGPTWYNTESANVLSTGEWIHVVATHSQNDAKSYLYINGVEAGTTNNSSGTYTSFVTNQHENSLGARKFSSTSPNTNFFDGKIDDVKVYDSYLTAQNIGQLYLEENPKALIGQWDMDGDAIDSSGNGYDGTPSSSLIWGNKHGIYDGNSSKIDLGNQFNSQLSVHGTWSISTWVKFDSLAANQTIIQSAISNSNRWALGTAVTGRLGYSGYNGSTSDTLSFAIPDTTNYHHVVVTVNNGSEKLYINGIETTDITGGASTNSAAETTIGAKNNDTFYFDGNIGVTEIYDGALSRNEINQLYTQLNPFYNGSYYVVTYTDPEGNNNYSNIQLNSSSGIIALEDGDLSTNNSESETVSHTDVKDEDDAGDPVRLETGAFAYDNTVMSYPATGMPFSFDIHYNNQGYYNGPLGHNFDFSYNKYLREDADGNIYFHNGKLGTFTFVKQPDDSFAYNTVFDGELTQSGGTYTIIQDGVMTYGFGENTKLSSMTDIYGNQMLFGYNQDAELTDITDTEGRNYSITYHAHGRIDTLTDFAGNAVSFDYYTAGDVDGTEHDLKDITLQNSLENKTISFTYALGTDYQSQHNIAKLIDSKGQVYVENIYDTGDRVTAQTYGNGTITYNYTLSGDDISANEVTDRNGNTTLYTFDTSKNTLSRTTDGDTYSFEYDANNKLIRETLPLGNGYTYTYDANGNLTERRQKTDATAADAPGDIVTNYVYDLTFNKMTQVTLPNGLVTDYTLDSLGNTIASTTSSIDTGSGTLSQSQSFVYDNLGQLTSTTDAYGVTTSLTYTGGLIDSTTKETQLTDYSYDTFGNLVSLTNPEGDTTSYTYDAFHNLATETTPEGVLTEYDYDANNNRLQTRIPLSPSEIVVTDIEYEILDKPSKIIQEIEDGRLATTQMTYDGNENLLTTLFPNGTTETRIYDEFDRVVRVDTQFGANISRQISYFDANGNLIQENANNNMTHYTHDLFDRLTLVTDAEGNTTEYIYDDMGNITETLSKDALGTELARRTVTYNELNLPLTMNEFDGTDTRVTSYSYDVAGNLLAETNARNNTTLYSYDSLMRLTEVEEPNGLTRTSNYDDNDNIISQAIVAPTKTITTTYVYDKDQRLTSEIDQVGNTTLTTYNNLNQAVQVTDGNNIPTDYVYDYRGNLLSETREGRVIGYEYDLMGNLIQLTDGEGNQTFYTYDGRNNRLTETDDTGELVSYLYDLNDNIIEQTDANGTFTALTYDDLNRVTQKDIILGADIAGPTQETYSYDGLSRLVQTTNDVGVDLQFTYNGYGELISENTNYTHYNEHGQNTLSTTTGYGYDDSGNITDIIYPSGRTIEKTYDSVERLTSLHAEDTPGSTTYQSIMTVNYDTIHKNDHTLGNGRITNYGYDALGRLSDLRGDGYTYDGVNNIITAGIDTYTYDTLDRLTLAEYGVNHKNRIKEGYAYDTMGNRVREDLIRLNNNNVEKTRSFDYATNTLNQYLDRENTNKDTGVSALPDGATGTGELMIEGDLLYDANGNMIGNTLNARRQYEYIYDHQNRLIEVVKYVYPQGTIGEDFGYGYGYGYGYGSNPQPDKVRMFAYSYDPLGRRILRETNNLQYTTYAYAGQDTVLEEHYSKKHVLKTEKEHIYTTQTDDIQASYLTEHSILKTQETYINNKGKEKTRTIKTPVQETNLYYYEKDHLGSVTTISTSTGGILEQYEYDVFGKPHTKELDGTLTNLKKSPIGNVRLFTGREYEKGLGLYYNRARYYHPILGRFISRDPIGIADDVNLYAYVGNSPVMYIDLMGTEGKLVVPKTAEEYYARNALNINLPESIVDAKKQGWRRLKQGESVYHSFGLPVSKFNVKYISPDGHREVVYRYDTGEIDNSPENMGSYNYYDPLTEPALHFEYDVVPYFRFGNNEQDTTTMSSRILMTTKYVPAISNEKQAQYETFVNTFSQQNFINAVITEFKY